MHRKRLRNNLQYWLCAYSLAFRSYYSGKLRLGVAEHTSTVMVDYALKQKRLEQA